MRKSLSVCMIVKDEESCLERCLNNVIMFADEIVIVDTGSMDKTKEIARNFTERVFDFEWCDDFSAARNFSFSKAQCDYIMWLDADDVVTKPNIDKINFLMEELDADVVMCLYDISFDSLNNPNYSYYRERILKRSNNFKWIGVVHEVIVAIGNVVKSDISIEHRKLDAKKNSGRNLRFYQKHIENDYNLSTRDLYYYARELYYNKFYDKAIEYFKQFLQKSDGYSPNIIDAHLTIKRCYDALGQNETGITELLMLLKSAVPNAEVSCEIAAWFVATEMHDKAIFWYRNALKFLPDPASGAFINKDYYGLIPLLGLCYCYYKTGDKENAKRYNDMVGEINPMDARYLYNKEYLRKQ